MSILAALIWAARTHQETVQSLPDILARDFIPLLEGKEVIDLNLGAIEERAKDLKREYPYIDEVIVRKMNPNGDSLLVYPFFYNVDQKGLPPEDDSLFQPKVLVNENGETLGALYIKINAQRSRLFVFAILGSILALLAISGLGLYTIRSKDRQVQKTTTLLEEKQRELIHLERLALVGQVTANLIHDLKKPVLNIRAEIGSIQDQPVHDSIKQEIDFFLGMIRELQLEGFLRRDQERGEFVDVGEIIERSLHLVKYAQGNVKVDIDLPDDLPFIFAQRRQLIQVFSNIILNAFQTLQGEGRVNIRAIDAQEEDERHLEISISDDGPGMPYDILAHIFEPFYSTRPDTESTGLGLYISQSIVEAMGGKITAHSIPKHGASFTLRFPLSEEEKS
ncbi:MAG: sensor histidine kinase [Candidatus Hinthialibacter sp.]